MLIKTRKINNKHNLCTVESELNVGDKVTINYYSIIDYATIIAIDHECKWVKVKSDATGAVYTYYKTRKKAFTLFTDTGKYSLDNYGSYLTFNYGSYLTF